MKNPIKYSRVLIALAIGTLFANAQDNNCQELLQYRNNKLVSEYIKKKKNLKIKQSHIEYIKVIKQELINGNSFETSGAMTAILTIKTLNDLTSAAIDVYLVLDPRKVPVMIDLLLDGLTNLERTIDLYNGKDEIGIKYLAKELAKEFGGILGKFINLQENLENFKGQENLKKELITQLESIEKELTKYNQKLSDYNSATKELRDYLNQVDRYLKENCKENLKENPIDIESKLWSVNNGKTDIAGLNYKLNELINDPDISNYYDFNNPRLLEEIMQLINSQNFNSTNLDDYLNKFMGILEKYRLNNSEILDNNKSINITGPKKLAKPKATRAVNTSSYSNFVGKNKSPNNGPYYSRATTIKPTLKKTNQKNKSKKSGCGHDHSNSSVVCQ